MTEFDPEAVLNAVSMPAEILNLAWPAPAALGLAWFLGPAAKAVRTNIASWSDFQTANLLKLSEKVYRRKQIETNGAMPVAESGTHPRVARHILDEASFVSDDLHQEYFAALIVDAQARSIEDDEALYYSRQMADLTRAQIAIHWAVYRSYAFAGLDPVAENPFAGERDRNALTVNAHESAFETVGGKATGSAITALERTGLFETAGRTGTPNDIAARPSLPGVNLYLMALGMSPQKGLKAMFRTDEENRRNGTLLTLPETLPNPLKDARICAPLLLP